jgi:hypothetical protein
MTPMDERTSLIEEIRIAFAGLSREGGTTLREARALDDYDLWTGSTEQERAPFRNLDVDQSWEEVPDDDIERFDSVFSFLNPIGFRYYLPAYMVWDIKYYDVSSSCSTGNVVYALCMPSDIGGWEAGRFSVFNPAQCRAICHFLKFMASHDDLLEAQINDALDAYWGRFCRAGA